MTTSRSRGRRRPQGRLGRAALGVALTAAASAVPASGLAVSAAPAVAPPAAKPTPAVGPATAAVGNPGEVVEKFPDGSPRVRYRTDAQSRRHGPYEEFYKSGKPRYRGGYTAGQKSGAWLTYDEAGKLVESAVFGKGGTLEGPYSWTAPDGKASFKATYAGGGLSGTATAADANGKVVRSANYPRTQADIRKNWAALWPVRTQPPVFLEEPSAGPVYKAGKVAPESLEQALKVAKLYRYLSGVSWQGLALSASDTVEAQHGAVILQKIGSLTHTPSKPADMDDAFFKLAYAGCNKSNLHQGQATIVDGLRGFMDDSDGSNIAGIGHRRWVLKPGLKKVGFGFAGGFTAMHVIDGTHDVPGFQYVTFPGEGYYPRQLVEPHYAWSVHFHPTRAQVPEAGELKVRVARLDDRLQPVGEPVAAPVVSVIRDPQQGWNVVVFKPEFKVEKAGMAAGKYWVEVAGLRAQRGNPMPFGYVVDLVEMEGGAPLWGAWTPPAARDR